MHLDQCWKLSMLEFIQLQDDAEVRRWSHHLAEGVFTTAPHYFNALFGDAETALRSLESWTRRSNSEFSGLCAALALEAGSYAGVFIALPGAEVPKRRLSDTLELLKGCKPERRRALKDFLSAFADVLMPVGETDCYLRTLAVDAEHRSRGYGRRLLEQMIAQGSRAGFHRFRLDVDAHNLPALQLYQSSGFRIIHEAEAQGFGHRTCAMLMER